MMRKEAIQVNVHKIPSQLSQFTHVILLLVSGPILPTTQLTPHILAVFAGKLFRPESIQKNFE